MVKDRMSSGEPLTPAQEFDRLASATEASLAGVDWKKVEADAEAAKQSIDPAKKEALAQIVVGMDGIEETEARGIVDEALTADLQQGMAYGAYGAPGEPGFPSGDALFEQTAYGLLGEENRHLIDRVHELSQRVTVPKTEPGTGTTFAKRVGRNEGSNISKVLENGPRGAGGAVNAVKADKDNNRSDGGIGGPG